MDIALLKVLAAGTRELLKQSQCLVGHSQSLDLIAALPGLRSWPEVNAFPDRVAACQLDLAATGRLSFRLFKKHQVERSAAQLLETLQPLIGSPALSGSLAVWPGGPPAGVYLTTSQSALDALLYKYEDATDGALTYAQGAGADHASTIALSEGGLWSDGLDRVPSGTLIVLGRVAFNQLMWEEVGQLLLFACLRAYGEKHRVAVLVDTPSPTTLHQDARLLVSTTSPVPGDDIGDQIVGEVAENGDLVTRTSQAFPVHARPPKTPMMSTVSALPPETIEPLRQALAERPFGLLLIGESEINEHSAMEQVAAVLALTEHAGPAARILQRPRNTRAEDLLPDCIKAIPLLASIQSAYAQGHRRMLISTYETHPELLAGYPDVLFIGGTYSHEISEVCRPIFRALDVDPAMMAARLIASLGLLHVPTRNGTVLAPDLVVIPPALPQPKMRSIALVKFLLEHRQLRWEDTVAHLLEAGVCSIEQLRKDLPRVPAIQAFLDQPREL